MKADRGFVKDEDGVALPASHFGGELQALRLPARKRGRRFAERQIAEPEVVQNLEARGHGLFVSAKAHGFVHVGGHELRERAALAFLVFKEYRLGFLRVAATPAGGTRDFHVGEELHVKRHDARAVALGTAKRPRVVGEVPGFLAPGLGVLRSGEKFSPLVVDVRVGGDGRAHVDADGRRVDQLHAADPLGFDVSDVVGHGLSFRERFQGRHEALQDERRLPRPRDARHHREAPLGDVERQGLHRVDRPGLEMNAPQVEEVFGRGALRSEKRMVRQIGSDLRGGILAHDGKRPLRQNPSALDARPGAEFDQVIDFREKRRVMVNQEHGIAVRDEVADHARKALKVRGMKSDRRFVEDIEHARRAVSHGARQLHALPFARRERRA